ncbi:ATP-binding protein [Clostridium sp. DSM 8431]|uniref:ATP-binding protein n=1 Tax=Clostridium sp. DSM 8431 TaxID=1761781 RepID=UPI0011138D3E
MREGSGIGLALVRGIVEEHNGNVKILDTEIGTEVEIKLPDIMDEEVYDNSISDEKDIISKINTEFSDIYD